MAFSTNTSNAFLIAHIDPIQEKVISKNNLNAIILDEINPKNYKNKTKTHISGEIFDISITSLWLKNIPHF